LGSELWRYGIAQHLEGREAPKFQVKPLTKLQKLLSAMEYRLPKNFSEEQKKEFLKKIEDSITDHWNKNKDK